jgi:hypothetical protein
MNARMENQSTGDTVEATIPAATSDEVVIVRVGAEGGDVSLVGRRNPESHWEFRRVVNDSSWSVLEEEELKPNRLATVPTWVSSWGEAMGLLDRYPWAELRPLAVRAEFRADVLVEVTRRLLEAPATRRDLRMAQWLAVCDGQPAR